MLKCDPRAFTRCPHRKGCSDSPEHTSFYEGTECDYFNQQVIHAPLTNADRIRAMSDEELSEWLCKALDCDFCKAYLQNMSIYSCCENQVKGVFEWLRKPAEEDT